MRCASCGRAIATLVVTFENLSSPICGACFDKLEQGFDLSECSINALGSTIAVYEPLSTNNREINASLAALLDEP